VTGRYPVVTHGLTMSLGGVAPPDATYLAELGTEIARLDAAWHSDHLAFTSAGRRAFHELLPLSFDRDTAYRVADRLESLAQVLPCPLAVENITYYAHPGKPELDEPSFLHLLLERTSAGLLLDVNNVYVNAKNHGFDAEHALREMPLDRVIEIHVAGHTTTQSGLVLDTHGAAVVPPVYELLETALERTGPVPVLLERDNAIPPLADLCREIGTIRGIWKRATARRHAPERIHARGA
jgi:uncharacterized protein (UPF0276 family)